MIKQYSHPIDREYDPGPICRTCHGKRRIRVGDGTATPAHDIDCPVCVGYDIGGGLRLMVSRIPE